MKIFLEILLMLNIMLGFVAVVGEQFVVLGWAIVGAVFSLIGLMAYGD